MCLMQVETILICDNFLLANKNGKDETNGDMAITDGN